MKNDEQRYNCPHCGGQLTVESSWKDMQVVCPMCNKEFTVALPDEPIEKMQQSPPVASTGSGKRPESKNKDYFWGRLFISWARAFALFQVISTLALIIYLLWQPFSDRNRELKVLAKYKVPSLVKSQKEFEEDYLKTARLIMAGRYTDAKINFPLDLEKKGGNFNEELLSHDDTVESLLTLSQYNTKIEKMSSVLRNFFLEECQKIKRKLNKGDAIKISFVNQKKLTASRSLMLALGENVNFFNADINVYVKNIDILSRILIDKKNTNKLSYGAELKKIADGITFVNGFLNAKRSEKKLGKDQEVASGKSSVTVGQNQFEFEKYVLNLMILQIKDITSPEYWRIADAAGSLNGKLLEHQRHINRINDDFKKNFIQAAVYASVIFVSGIFFAFLLMVLADYLCAHFDSSVTLKNIVDKMKSFLLIPLLVLTLFSGCSNESPDEKLKQELESLRLSVLETLFAEKVADNPDATAYAVPGKELVIVAGGIKKITGTEILTGAAYYQVIRLVCTASVACSAVQKYDKPPFTHKATLQASVQFKTWMSDTGKDPDGTPGLEFNFFPPDFTETKFNKEKWMDGKIKMIPQNQQLDHAVALHNISTNQPQNYTDNKIYEICYNGSSRKWELQEGKILVSLPVPPAYSEADVERAMRGYHYKKMEITPDFETKIFWFNVKEYDSADKIYRQNLIKINGIWKKKSVVLNTRKLGAEIKIWNDKNRVSLADLEILMRAIKENPEAENRQDAVALAEKAFLEIFLKISEEPEEKDRERILRYLNFAKNSPYMDVLNRQKMMEECQKKLDILSAEREKVKKYFIEISKVITEFHSDSEVDKLLEGLKQFPQLLGYKPYNDLVEQLELIIALSNGDEVAMDKVIRMRGYLGSYQLLSPCDECRGSGLKNCRSCNNTGRCPFCGGSGSKSYTPRFSIGRSGPRTITTSCVTTCRDCAGRTEECRRCRGLKYQVRSRLVKDAFRDVLKKIESFIAEGKAVL